MNKLDLIYNEERNTATCPYCKEEIEELTVTIKGWGRMKLDNRYVGEVEVEHITEAECPYCGREVEYD